MKLLIDYQCPQCGAAAQLAETDRLVHCAYCRVASYLEPRRFFHYAFTPAAPAGHPIVYAPYWRFKGVQFNATLDGVRHRLVDVSRLALNSPLLPPSVGLRSQTLSLRIAAAADHARYLVPEVRAEKLLRAVGRQPAGGPDRTPYHQGYVGESLSLLYAPFYVTERVMDGILNRPVSGIVPSGTPLFERTASTPGGALTLLPTICPGCGWDLEGARNSVMLFCRNCRGVWRPATDRFVRVRAGVLGTPPAEARHLVPFWRIRAAIQGLDLATMADLVRLANLPRVVQPHMQRQGVFFWCPAFNLPPLPLLRVMRTLCVAQPADALEAGLPDGTVHPVTLPLATAVASVKVILADLLKPRSTMVPLLPQVRVVPRSADLVFIPLAERVHDLVHPDLQLTLNRRQLSVFANRG